MREQELEIQHYWRVMQMPGAEQTVAEYRDELEVLSAHTSSPALRRACSTSLNRFSSVYGPAAKVAAK